MGSQNGFPHQDSVFLRLEGYASGITARCSMRGANRNLACRTVVHTVVVGAVFDVATDTVNVLGLTAAFFLMIHEFISFR
jgi:hypothetical protein